MTSARATGSARAKRSEMTKVLRKTSAKSLLFSSNFIMGLCQLNAYMVSSHYISNDWKQYLKLCKVFRSDVLVTVAVVIWEP